MIQMKTKMRFLDAPAVQRALDQATRRSPRRAGAFIRQRAQSSIRRCKGTSLLGKPPQSDAGHSRRPVFFAHEPAGQTVAICPVLFRQGETPRLPEFGGTTTHLPGRTGRTRRRVYRKRPFIGAAMKADMPEPTGFLCNTVPEGWPQQTGRLPQVDSPQAEVVVLVVDDLNTHGLAWLYEAFEPADLVANAP